MIASEKLFIENLGKLRDWLKEHYAQQESVWLVKWEKAMENLLSAMMK